MKLYLILIMLSAGFFTPQDTTRIRNVHGRPDSSSIDTTKLNGGALIDTIHTKSGKDLEKMREDSDSSKTNKK